MTPADQDASQGTDRPHAAPPGDDRAEPLAWFRDWMTLWQSELAGMAGDRELREQIQAALDTWSTSGQAVLAALGAMMAAQRSAGHDNTPTPPWPAAADAASGAGPGTSGGTRGGASAGSDDALGALSLRIAELERRIAGLESRNGVDTA